MSSMSHHPTRRCARLPLLAALFALLVCASALARPPAAAWSAPEDEAALKEVVGKLVAAWGTGDVDAFIALWTGPASRGALREDMRKRFEAGRYSFQEPHISHVKVEGDRAGARLVVRYSFVPRKSGQSEQAQLAWNLTFARDTAGA